MGQLLAGPARPSFEKSESLLQSKGRKVEETSQNDKGLSGDTLSLLSKPPKPLKDLRTKETDILDLGLSEDTLHMLGLGPAPSQSNATSKDCKQSVALSLADLGISKDTMQMLSAASSHTSKTSYTQRVLPEFSTNAAKDRFAQPTKPEFKGQISPAVDLQQEDDDLTSNATALISKKLDFRDI